MRPCDECQQEYDFDNCVSASCSTCDKRWLCDDCKWIHKCIEGKSRRLIIIGNPKWITNLVSNLPKSE